MSQIPPPTSGSSPLGGPTDTTSTPGASETGQQAKQQATDLTASARDQARDVAGTAKEEAGHVVEQAKSATGDVLREAQSTFRDQAQTQTHRLAGVLNSVGEDFDALLQGRPQEAGQIGEYAQRFQGQVSDLAGRVDELGFDGVVREVQRFARRRPGAFLALSAGVGFLVGRMARGVRDASQDSSDHITAGRSPELERPYASPPPLGTPTYPTTEAYPATGPYGTDVTAGQYDNPLDPSPLGDYPPPDSGNSPGDDLGVGTGGFGEPTIPLPPRP